MALQCNVTLNYGSYQAGSTPPPMATVQVYNPNAVSVNVSSVQMTFVDVNGNAIALPVGESVPPIGPGMTTLVPTLSSITIGPFPIVVGSAASINSAAAVNQAGNLNPVNPQISMPSPRTIMVGATVYGSDLSVNVAGKAALLVSNTSFPPPGFQGGVLQFGSANNMVTGIAVGGL